MRIDSGTIANGAFTAACLAIVVLVGIQIRERMTVASAQPPQPVTDVTPMDISIADAPVQGDANAKLAILEFSDFQCPYCGKYAKETYQQLKGEFVAAGKVKYVFVNLPLSSHQYARGAAEAAECAHVQGRFWPMHDRLFAQQELLAPANLEAHAQAVGLDAQSFATCLAGTAPSLVDKDRELAKRLGVRSTPTFLIGTVNPDGTVRVTKQISGAHQATVFRQALQAMGTD